MEASKSWVLGMVVVLVGCADAGRAGTPDAGRAPGRDGGRGEDVLVPVDTGPDERDGGAADVGRGDACTVVRVFEDRDLDGHGDPATGAYGCDTPLRVTLDDDCDDTDERVHPGAGETCDGLDGDCDGAVDEGVLMRFYRDVDGDGFGVGTVVLEACSRPAGYAVEGTDCDDACAGCRPGGVEVCDGRDQDCDGTLDDGVLSTFHADADRDGFGDAGSTREACTAPVGYVVDRRDCNDRDARISPSAAESCNGVDDDCNGTIDGAAASPACNTPAVLTSLFAASATCTASACAASSCRAGRGDCTPGGACETDTTSSATSCGACGRACAWGVCRSSACSLPRQVSVGGGTVCATLASDTVECWGVRGSAEASLGSVIEVAVGVSFECFRMSTGHVWCRGSDALGQLGNGSAAGGSSPVRVVDASGTALSDVTAITAGADHACAVTGSGGLYCWGRNDEGQVGDGTRTNRPYAVRVMAAATTMLNFVRGVDAGALHACAIAGALSRVYCWGANGDGQLGDATRVGRLYAVPIHGEGSAATFDSITLISAGERHTCAVAVAGQVACWGAADGRLGHGGIAPATTPFFVLGFEAGGGRSVVAGRSESCILTTANAVVCFGLNDSGAVGDGTFVTRYAPVGLTFASEVPAGEVFTALSAGFGAVCGITNRSRVLCWGEGSLGEIGDGTRSDRARAMLVTSP